MADVSKDCFHNLKAFGLWFSVLCTLCFVLGPLYLVLRDAYQLAKLIGPNEASFSPTSKTKDLDHYHPMLLAASGDPTLLMP